MTARRRVRAGALAGITSMALVCVPAVGVLQGCSAEGGRTASVDRPANADDQWGLIGPHDAIPRGVPGGYSWRLGAEKQTPLRQITGQFRAVNVWGQVFVPVTGTGNDRMRVAVRNPRVFFRTPDGWLEGTIPSGSPGGLEGAYWKGDYSAQKSNATTRQEPDGSWSAPLQPLGRAYDTFHFWWVGMYPRVPIPPNAEGIFVSQEMRLIPEDGMNNIRGARYLASSGADLFATQTTKIDKQGWNQGISQPRFRWLGDDWQLYAASTLTPAELTTFPPP